MTMPPAKQPWLPEQEDLLEHLAAGGASAKVMSERVGHPLYSCRTKLSELRSKRRNCEQWKIDRKISQVLRQKPEPKPKPAAPIIMQAQASTAPLRAASTSKLVMDAELRARISEQGITAGLLGDPRPGRSALDAKKARA